MQLDQRQTPTVTYSESKIDEVAEKALTYLRRTNNLDTAEMLGLSFYLEEDPHEPHDGT